MALTSVIDAILAKGRIGDADVLALRRDVYADGAISKEEASRLFAINDACPSSNMSWGQFFTEALSDFVVHQMQPSGYVDEINAEWLITHIDSDGKVETVNELELLIGILEKAKSVPECLNLYALNQVKRAVLSGEGVSRSGKSLRAGVVTEGDVEILRRILYAYGSGNNIGITTAEAELLFDINDATAKVDNHPSWNVLFAQAIANHLMMAHGHVVQDRETALRQEKWLDEKPSMDGFLTVMVKGLREIYKNTDADDSETRARNRRLALEAKMQQSEQISTSEANWLSGRINRDGSISAAERAVLTFIKQESPNIDPVLKPLLDLVA
jgi:hypothetical protein